MLERWLKELAQPRGDEIHVLARAIREHAARWPAIVEAAQALEEASSLEVGPRLARLREEVGRYRALTVAGQFGAILVISADPAVGRAVGRAARRDTVLVERAARAAKLLSTRPFSAIVLDLDLPDVAATTLVDELRAQPGTSSIPVIALRGVEHRPKRKRPPDPRISRTFDKPVDTAELAQAIDQVISARPPVAGSALGAALRGAAAGDGDGQDPDALAQAISSGGRYDLRKRIGQGATGCVYAATQTSMGRDVAIKVLFPQWCDDRRARERFQRESVVLAKLDHPNVVRAIDAGHHAGLYYLVMELVDGESLAERLRREGPLGETRSLRIVRQIASAIGHAHRHGVVHRDVKPANVLLGRDGHAKLADLGLAKMLWTGLDTPPDSPSSSVGGTPAYMSPEQLRGDAVDVRSDLYSLGLTFYECLTGQPAFPATSISTLIERKLMAPVRPPPEVAPQLGPHFLAVLQRLCAVRPAARYATPAELLDDLERLERGERPLAPPPSNEDRASLLLVEDDDGDALLATTTLERAGYDVVRVRDGDEAVARFEDAIPPDLVVLDLMLPGSPGIEVLERMRGQLGWREVPIVVLTAQSEEPVVVSALERGASDYVMKPFRADELTARVRRFLRPRA